MGIATFMSSPVGRIARVIVGLALIVLGLSMGGPAGWIVAVVGVVPIVAGAANLCLIAPVVGAPFKGSDIRRY